MAAKKRRIVSTNGISPTLTTKPNFYIKFPEKIDIKSITDEELWPWYSLILKELKIRNLVRTKNIIGDRGEFLAAKVYNSTPNEPKLQLVLKGTQNVDAISRNGKTYNIKTVTLPNKTTGVFYGLEPKGSDRRDMKIFDYVIIVILDEDLNLKEILEIDWDSFVKIKHWHSRMKAWNLTVNEEFRKLTRKVFPQDKR